MVSRTATARAEISGEARHGDGQLAGGGGRTGTCVFLVVCLKVFQMLSNCFEIFCFQDVKFFFVFEFSSFAKISKNMWKF